MKTFLFAFIFIALGKVSYCQQLKQSIDYQYYRDDKSYYAFELFKEVKNTEDNQLLLNFTSNAHHNKIDKIYIKSGDVELRLKFKVRTETIHSDNPEQKFYPISFNKNELVDKKIQCEATIIFKMEGGIQYALPFNTCNLKELMAKN